MKVLRSAGLPLLGIGLSLIAWGLLSKTEGGLIIAGPVETLKVLLGLLDDTEFTTQHLCPTLKRVALALLFGVITGGALGVAAGLAPPLRLMIAPLRWMLMSVPGVVVVIFFMLWFGMGTPMVVCITATMIAPVVYVNVVGGMANTDRQLLEMARVYKLPLSIRVTRIHATAIAGPLLSGAVIAAGNGIRVVVLAELLGANEGLGYALALARTRLQTAELYALALLSMLIVAGVELALLRPVRNRFQEKMS